jgi:hypothetical protein
LEKRTRYEAPHYAVFPNLEGRTSCTDLSWILIKMGRKYCRYDGMFIQMKPTMRSII